MLQQNLTYAGFWIRSWAAVIDTILLMLMIAPLLISIYGWDYFDVDKTGFIAGPADVLISWIFPAVVVILFWLKKQATPGKMAFSTKVVDAKTGGAMSVGQSVGRYLAYFVSMLPLGLGILWIAFDRKKQGWHDKLAGTVVVRIKDGGTLPVRFENNSQ